MDLFRRRAVQSRIAAGRQPAAGVRSGEADDRGPGVGGQAAAVEPASPFRCCAGREIAAALSAGGEFTIPRGAWADEVAQAERAAGWAKRSVPTISLTKNSVGARRYAP